jgi:hypothetical protein
VVMRGPNHPKKLGAKETVAVYRRDSTLYKSGLTQVVTKASGSLSGFSKLSG